jgi:ferric-dicitrate binding protein FerR (iron transport regulator)
MGVCKPKVRTAVSMVVALAVVSAFTLSSLAAPNVGKRPSDENSGARVRKVLADVPSGRLTGTGHINIDGYEAQSGATVLSGNTVSTGADGKARVDLGPLGRFELRPNTTVTLTFLPDSVLVRMNGGGLVVHSSLSTGRCQVKILGENSKVIVDQGQVKVDSAGDVQTLNAGQEANFSQPSDVTTNGEAVFIALSMGRDRSATAAIPTEGGNYSSAGRYGVAAMIGVAGGVALGIALGKHDNSGSTLPKASTVVP